MPYESDVQPRCNFLGQCTCEIGYEFTEDGEMCRFVGHLIDESKSDELGKSYVRFTGHHVFNCMFKFLAMWNSIAIKMLPAIGMKWNYGINVPVS